MQKDVERAARAFGPNHPVLRIEQGDMCRTDFGKVDVVTILDALHYFDHAGQEDVLRRIHAAHSLPDVAQLAIARTAAAGGAHGIRRRWRMTSRR